MWTLLEANSTAAATSEMQLVFVSRCVLTTQILPPMLRCLRPCALARLCARVWPSAQWENEWHTFLVVPCATRAEEKHFKTAHGDMKIILTRDACADVTGLAVGLTTLSGKGRNMAASETITLVAISNWC